MKPIATDNYDFERLITDGYAYVDKKDMLWKLATAKDVIYFISRLECAALLRYTHQEMRAYFLRQFHNKKSDMGGRQIWAMNFGSCTVLGAPNCEMHVALETVMR